MAVSAEDLAAIAQVLCAPDADAQVLTELRRRFAHLSWTKCAAADVVETPYRSYQRFDIHLLDSADHCAHITEDPSRATGIVLALRDAGQ